MSYRPSMFMSFQELWHGSPRWQNLLLMSVVCTALTVVLHLSGSGGGPVNSYTPPGQPSVGPVAPPKAGMSQPLNVVAPVEAPPIKITPSQSADEIEVRTRPQAPSEASFGQSSGGWSGGITPSQSVGEIEVRTRPQASSGKDFGQSSGGWSGGITPGKSLDEIEVRPRPQTK